MIDFWHLKGLPIVFRVCMMELQCQPRALSVSTFKKMKEKSWRRALKGTVSCSRQRETGHWASLPASPGQTERETASNPKRQTPYRRHLQVWGPPGSQQTTTWWLLYQVVHWGVSGQVSQHHAGFVKAAQAVWVPVHMTLSHWTDWTDLFCISISGLSLVGQTLLKISLCSPMDLSCIDFSTFVDLRVAQAPLETFP